MPESKLTKLSKLIRLVAGLNLLFSGAIYGGGAEVQPIVIQPEVVYNTGVYVEADGGYALINWLKTFDLPDNMRRVHNGRDGLAGGGIGGYQWRPYFATELGGFYMPVFRLLNEDGRVIIRTKSSFFDLAAKFMLPIPNFEYLSPFLKVGVAFRRYNITIDFSDTTRATTGGFATAPFLGAGLQYNFNPYLYAILQWNYLGTRVLHVTDGPLIGRIKVPSINLFLAGVGIKFLI